VGTSVTLNDGERMTVTGRAPPSKDGIPTIIVNGGPWLPEAGLTDPTPNILAAAYGVYGVVRGGIALYGAFANSTVRGVSAAERVRIRGSHKFKGRGS
jgi:hypothetical protein